MSKYTEWLEATLLDEYKALFEEEGDFHIPGVAVFKLSMLEEGNFALVQAMEVPALGENVWLEDRYVDRLLELEECGAIEMDSTCDLVTVYKVHDIGPRDLYLAVWSYKLLQWLER